MKKRAAGIAVVSALLCGVVAVQTPNMLPAEQDSVSVENTVEVLVPDTSHITFEPKQPVGTVRIDGLKDMLLPAEDYGEILPYAARILGWKQDGTPVCRYALADSAGELITNPVYTKAERTVCGDQILWLLHDRTESGMERVTCAVQDGSWILGPFEGTVTVQDSHIFIKRWNSPATIVYNSDGKILGQVNGTVTSCAGGVIVSQQDTTWYINNSETMKVIAALDAVHIGTFSGGTAAIQLTETEWGFITKDGTVVQTDAAWIDETCNGYALAKNRVGNFGILHVSGETAVQFQYSNGVHCGKDYPLYQLWEDEMTCFVLRAGTKQRLHLPEDLHAQQITALPNNYFAYLDENGRTVVFDDLQRVTLEGKAEFYQQDRTLIASMENGYQTFSLDESEAGKWIRSYRYCIPEQEAANMDSVFTVEDVDTGLQGIGNTKGRLILRAEYDSISSIDGSYFAAIYGDWSGIIDSHGDWIIRTRLIGMDEGGNQDEVQ